MIYITDLSSSPLVINLGYYLNRQPKPVPRDLSGNIDSEEFPHLSGVASNLQPLSLSEELAELRLQVSQSHDLERAWRAVSETARDLTVLREPDSVLQAIVERSQALLGSHLCWITGPHTDIKDELVVLAINGITTESTKLMHVNQEHGVAGYVRRTHSPFTTPDYFSEKRVIHDEQIDSILRDEGVQSMLAVPMLSGGDFIGVLVLADRISRHYTPPDIATISMLAAHAVVAVLNAQAFSKTRQALAQAEKSNLLLLQHTKALELAAEAHERLTSLVAQGGSQVDVCRTVASLLGAEVVVVDGADNILCSAGSDGVTLKRPSSALHHWMATLHVHAALDESRLKGRSVAIKAPPGRYGRLAAILGGTRLIGGLIVLNDAPISDVAVRTLERSAMVMALMMLAPPWTGESLAADSAQLLSDLLNPLRAGSSELAALAAKRGLSDTKNVLALIEVALKGGVSEATSKAVQRRLKTRLDSRAIFCEIDGRVVVLCPDVDPMSLRIALQKALGETPQLDVLGLISPSCEMLSMLPDNYDRLIKCIVVIRKLTPENKSCIRSIRLVEEFSPLIASFGREELYGAASPQSFIDTTIGALISTDRSRDTNLASSLLTYFDLGCNAKQAAMQLGIHVNTLNNRLTTASSLLGCYDMPGRRLSIHLALQLHKLRSS